MGKLTKKQKKDAIHGALILIGLLVLGGIAGSLCFGNSEPGTEKKPEGEIALPAEQDSNDWGELSEEQLGGGEIVAKWELDWLNETKMESVLVYQDGKMIRLWLHPEFEKPSSKEWFERPPQNRNERKFDTGSPDCETCGYVTISRSGIVTYFEWDGNLVNTVLATFMDPEAMSIGNNPQEKPCTPKKLSPASVEALRLYKQLHAFKDDPEFIRVGFSPSGPYSAWIKAVDKLDGSGREVLLDLNFLPGELSMLGTSYVSRTKSSYNHIEYMERKIEAGIALAKCQ